MRFPVFLMALATLTGCGLDELGVLSVHITLEPTEPDDLPVEVDGLLDPELLHGVSGSTEADVPEGRLTVDAAGLPEPPEGWVWVPVLIVEADERAGLPGAHADDDGHAAEEDGPETVMLPPLVLVGDDQWSTIQVGDTLGDHPLGGLRAGMVMLMTSDQLMDGPTLMVLEGEATFENDNNAGSTPEEEEGHSHGV